MARALVRWVLPSRPPGAPNIRRQTHLIRVPTIKAFSNRGGGGDYLHLTDEELTRQCEMDTFKSSGPGGQHRNKRESAVRLKHLPTGIIAQAVEDRSQHKNRVSAIARLRTLLALKGRQLTWMIILLPGSFFKFYQQSQPLDLQILVLRLVPITQSLLWECSLYLI